MKQLITYRPRIQLRSFSSSLVVKSMSWPKADYGPMEVQRSMLLNGIKVAAAKPLGAPIAACTVMYQAGSRYEVDDQLGASHFIRACSSASGCGYTSFSKMRMLQQYGCSITCTSDRQTVAFTMRCPPTCFSQLKYYLLDVAARCCFNHWEVDDRKPLVRHDLYRIHPEQRVLDMVQTASWAGPLANSIFCTEERIEDMSENSLNCFASTNYKTDELTVASVGIPFEETMRLAELIEPKVERPRMRWDVISCPRRGFELLDLGRDSDTWIAVAVPGCGTCDFRNLLCHAIIAAACGTDDIQSGQHDLDRTLMPPLGSMAGSDVFTRYRAFNISYRESGVFGVVAKTRACSAWNVALAASEFLANVGDLDFKQIDIGKARLKLDLCLHDEDCVRVSEGLALQLANNVQIDSAKSGCAMVDQLSADEISCVAKTLSSQSGYMALAVVGDVGAVPHDRELMCNR